MVYEITSQVENKHVLFKICDPTPIKRTSHLNKLQAESNGSLSRYFIWKDNRRVRYFTLIQRLTSLILCAQLLTGNEQWHRTHFRLRFPQSFVAFATNVPADTWAEAVRKSAILIYMSCWVGLPGSSGKLHRLEENWQKIAPLRRNIKLRFSEFLSIFHNYLEVFYSSM